MNDMSKVEQKGGRIQGIAERAPTASSILKSADSTTISRLKSLVPEKARNILRLSAQKAALTASGLFLLISSGCGNIENPSTTPTNTPEQTPISTPMPEAAQTHTLTPILEPTQAPTLPRSEIPSSYINDLKDVIAPLTKLMPSTRQNVAIKVHKTPSDGVHYANDHVKGDVTVRKNEIEIHLPDASPENMSIGKAVAFHETAHIFDQGDKTPSGYLKQQMKKRMGRKYTSDEYKILTESSYCNISTCKSFGHPEDNFQELFASSITILKFYPFEFIEKLEELKNPESKRFLATNGLVCMDALREFSAIPVEYTDLPFDPSLVAYLMQEGQNSVP